MNDLSKPGASTFESLGGLEYKQNVHIQLECERKQIPTDGLVLRGWYTTITLAVYGSLTKSLSNTQEIISASATTAVPVGGLEQPAESVPKAPEPQPDWYFENPAQTLTVNVRAYFFASLFDKALKKGYLRDDFCGNIYWSKQLDIKIAVN